MARLARFVVPGAAHHVTRRGNGRQQTFFRDTDYAARSESTGRPLGDGAFLDRVEALLDRDPRPARRAPKPKRQLNALSP
jgi:hypothetical protein